jgi:high affinity Mn2+ porin
VLARTSARLAAGLLLLVSGLAAAESGDFDVHGQATYVWQRKSAFDSPYSGPHSLRGAEERSYSFTATAALGYRPWRDGELYFDPEVAQGVALSGLTGLGGFTNGEIARTSGPTLKLYRARLFLRQTWSRGGGSERQDAEMNQLAGSADRRRTVLTVGTLSVTDVFDDNAYSHDPRTQFLNWSLMTHGAFDFAADARGYSWGAALEIYHDDWTLRAGRFAQPRQPNQMELDPQIFRHYGDQAELEHRHELAGRPGAVRLLAFRNRARMASYADALDAAAATGGTPDLDAVRGGEKVKTGYGVNVEQSVSPDVGAFLRASRADGRTETYAFTEIDRSVSGGVVMKGAAWRRAGDALGVALARNGLSNPHRDYLAAGGLGFFLGDGRLNYRPEQIVEAYYSFSVTGALALSLDFQRIANPGYNADRGPARVGSVRLHAEF